MRGKRSRPGRGSPAKNSGSGSSRAPPRRSSPPSFDAARGRPPSRARGPREPRGTAGRRAPPRRTRTVWGNRATSPPAPSSPAPRPGQGRGERGGARPGEASPGRPVPGTRDGAGCWRAAPEAPIPSPPGGCTRGRTRPARRRRGPVQGPCGIPRRKAGGDPGRGSTRSPAPRPRPPRRPRRFPPVRGRATPRILPPGPAGAPCAGKVLRRPGRSGKGGPPRPEAGRGG